MSINIKTAGVYHVALRSNGIELFRQFYIEPEERAAKDLTRREDGRENG